MGTSSLEKDQLGRYGEQIAARHLTDDGLRVLDRNWRCSEGELDIVARDGPGTLVFCEVKTRRSLRHGTPIEAVDAEKSHRLRRLAARWLKAHPRRADRLRFDVIGILAPRGGPLRLTHRREVL
ncbi:YraN family protein [Phytomonospora sp. NPDC050363]|uniref:YraN family protein n=1 Tax=Phytomonospora sp. NPDC050363 TaxID=3155642 RepID=UPI00341048BF